jgi:hypothetical protein
MRFADLADALGLLPRGMIDSDTALRVMLHREPRLGRPRGRLPHLWQHGNCSIFCVNRAFHADANGRRRVSLKFTFDERIEDGLYSGRGLARIREWLEHPEKL